MAFLSPQLAAAWQPLVLAQLSHLAQQDNLNARCMSTAASSKPQQPPPQGSQSQLVDKLLTAGMPLTSRAESALRAVDRRHFVQTYAGVPDTVAWQVQAPRQSMSHDHPTASCWCLLLTLWRAAQDTALPISCGQTMPSFSVHARFLALLEPHVQPGATVLDLGAGTCRGGRSIKSMMRAATADQQSAGQADCQHMHGKQ